MATSLFQSGGNVDEGRRVIVQFRAGKMKMEGNRVVADPRKGLLILTQDPVGLTYLVWKDRTTGHSDEPLLVIAGEATYNRVPQCTTGRVYVLNYDWRRLCFFWLQEPSTDKDDENAALIKQTIGDTTKSNPPRPTNREPREDEVVAPPMTPQPAAGRPAATSMSAMQSILASLNAGQGSAAAHALPRPPRVDIDLQDVVNSDELLDALREDPAYYMARLHSTLPPGTDPSASVVEQVRNPQVSASASLLTAALADPMAYREVVNAFAIGSNPPTTEIGAHAFVARVIEEREHANKSRGADAGAERRNEGADPPPPSAPQ